jgi:hypothetical protein
MKEKRISVINECRITGLDGTTKLEKIRWLSKENKDPLKLYSKEGMVEHFIKPDLVICENGIGAPKVSCSGMFEAKDGHDLSRVVIGNDGIPQNSYRC